MSHSRQVRRALPFLLFVALAGCGGSSGGGPAPNPQPNPQPGGTGIVLTEAFPGLSFTQPVALLMAPGDTTRWFVVEQSGVVRTFANDPMASASTVFLDIAGKVDNGPNEAGLLGAAFHPDWGTNGNYEFFVSYTAPGPLTSVISRFYSADTGATIDPAVEEVILTVPQDFGNHNGGQIEFGPDGLLYAGFGDGGNGGDPRDRAQDTSNLLGTIVRVDVDSADPYAVPLGNPFANGVTTPTCAQGFGGGACGEIFAWGLRNPWRWSFDRQTGALWAGDVGQGAFEEIDVVEVGGNYGWRCFEGTMAFDGTGNCPGGYTDPVTEYGRGVGQSVTGGYVYRGTAVPSLVGQYVYGDFITGSIFAIPANSAPGVATAEILDAGFNISTFAEDADGEVYVIDYSAGRIYRIDAAP